MAYQVHDIEGAQTQSKLLGKSVEEAATCATTISKIMSDLQGLEATAGLAEKITPVFNQIANKFQQMEADYQEGNKILQKFFEANQEVADYDIAGFAASELQ